MHSALKSKKKTNFGKSRSIDFTFYLIKCKEKYTGSKVESDDISPTLSVKSQPHIFLIIWPFNLSNFD